MYMLKLPCQGLQICFISFDYVCSEIEFEVHLFQRDKHPKIRLLAIETQMAKLYSSTCDVTYCVKIGKN